MQRHLPPPFRPKLHAGYAVAGICLIGLDVIRPRHIPAMFGLKSENAAHRVAVEWDDVEGVHAGVYINRRDTGSILNQIAGGRLFPGEHHRAEFRIADDIWRVSLQMASAEGDTQIEVVGQAAGMNFLDHRSFNRSKQRWPFFESGGLGCFRQRLPAPGKRLESIWNSVEDADPGRSQDVEYTDRVGAQAISRTGALPRGLRH